MLHRYFLRISYQGTNYSGWQIQPNAISVQEVIQNTLTKLNGNEQVKVMGCGRTDAGVHAIDFLLHLDFPEIEDQSHFIYKMNHMLPNDIAVHDIARMPEKAHTRFDAVRRTYKYYFHFKKNPFLSDRSLLISDSIDIEKMKEGGEELKLHSDFEAFSRVKTAVNNFICDLSDVNWEREKDQLIFTISANRFLRNMVRAIVGTLIELGEGKISLEEFKEIIASKNRNNAGKSAPAKGLFLVEVEYPYQVP
ncbi:MAG: tRNA pseudouridine(38-40) synthase TruA [Crocinitomicaceae bacterium]